MTGPEYAAERKRLGMSQRQLASALELSRETVGRIERMPRVPRHHAFALVGYVLRDNVDGRAAGASA